MEAQLMELPEVADLEFVTPLQISDNVFVIASDGDTCKIIKYDATSVSWEEIFDYSGWETCEDYTKGDQFDMLYNVITIIV